MRMRDSRRWACALLALTLALAPAGCAAQQDLTPVLEAGTPAATPAATPSASPSATPSASPEAEEASLETGTDAMSRLGYTVCRVKTYKTNQHIFLQKERSA